MRSHGPCRPLASYAWTVLSAAGQAPQLQQLAGNATGSQLSLPAALVAGLPAGDYTFGLSVSNWLGATASTNFTFTKQSLSVPSASILGGASQQFVPSAGAQVQVALDLSSVCPGAWSTGAPAPCTTGLAPTARGCAPPAGSNITYLWQESSGLLPAGSFAAAKKNLVLKVGGGPAPEAWRQRLHPRFTPPRPMQGPLSGVTGGEVLNFTFSAALSGAGTTTASVSLTALSSPVLAVLAGPRGTVLDSSVLTFDASQSYDPDDPANKAPFRWAPPATSVGKAGGQPRSTPPPHCLPAASPGPAPPPTPPPSSAAPASPARARPTPPPPSWWCPPARCPPGPRSTP